VQVASASTVTAAIRLAAGDDPGPYDDLSRREQDDLVQIGAEICDWIATHDPAHRDQLAEAIHDFRQRLDPSIVDWDNLPDDLVDVIDAVTDALADWLIRQGAWQ
jgi:hypothetical protein